MISLQAQHAFKNIIEVGAQDEIGFDLQESSDKSFLVAGYYTVVANSQWNSGLFRVDSIGALLGQTNYGSNGDNGTFNFKKTADGGYVLCGYTNAGGTTYKILVIKLDASMNFQWEKVLNVTPYELDWSTPGNLYDLIEARDGNIIAAGFDNISLTEKSGYIAKLNVANGDTIWVRRFIKSGYTYSFSSVTQSPDGGYVATGIANSTTTANNNVLILKFNEDGNFTGEKIIGGTTVNQIGKKIIATQNGYVIAGKRNGNGWEAMLMKTDLSGDNAVSKIYGDGNADWDDIFSLDSTNDWGYVISGYAGNGNEKIGYCVKTDSNLTKVWSKKYSNSNTTILYSVINTTDGGYALCGYTNTGVRWDLILIKTDAAGNETANNFPVPVVTAPSTAAPSTPVQFTTNVNYGTSPFSYKWTGEGGFSSTLQNPTHTFTNGGTFRYTFEVTDANGAKGLFAGQIIISSCSIPTVTAIVDSSYCNINNGAITIAVSGGISPYSFSWSNGAVSKDLTDLGAGTYSVSVTGNDGCVSVLSNTVPNNTGPSITATVNNASCGVNNGTITLAVAGSISPYTFSWSNGAITQNLVDLGAGTFTVSVTGNDGCMATLAKAVSKTQNPIISILTQSNPTTNGGTDGAIDISVVSGVQPYQYNWSNGQLAQDIDSLIAGTYTVTVTDSKGCTVVAQYTLTEPVSMNENKNAVFSDVIVIPNPFRNSVHFYFDKSETTGKINVEIFSLTGKKLYAKNLEKGSDNLKIDFTETISAGTYFYKINGEGGMGSRKQVWGKLVKF
ncbi:MAG: hypothetical protein A3H98_13710 [Bacteroidetes bacterium RIFCSPLOWO2_02_FULL_36_8]|nr:MAG: hypothetical protein A3H98_13710 [Bacteroidetes bacterium RIFCSPLOWO2_02_FULL_36_8]OFY70876.1 MAG: hypothetical protein A3G23_12205 [Bacteroidetes bacterium RIFCSPLOWO2_12_FULL_37_12]